MGDVFTLAAYVMSIETLVCGLLGAFHIRIANAGKPLQCLKRMWLSLNKKELDSRSDQ